MQILATEIYNAKNDLGPKIIADIFYFVEKPYNLRNNSVIQRQANRTVYFGTKSISSLTPKLWELIPSKIKNAKLLNIFKEKTKSWTRAGNTERAGGVMTAVLLSIEYFQELIKHYH